jgi:hypothetical protein
MWLKMGFSDGNESLGFIEVGKLIDQLSDYQLLRTVSAPSS